MTRFCLFRPAQLIAAVAALALAGCGPAGGSAPASAGTRGALPPLKSSGAGTLRDGAVMGRDVRAVTGLLGQPRLDIREGAGRKLQFTGTSCVADVYFYSPKAGAEPVATHVDARAPDGRDVDRNACIDALRRR